MKLSPELTKEHSLAQIARLMALFEKAYLGDNVIYC